MLTRRAAGAGIIAAALAGPLHAAAAEPADSADLAAFFADFTRKERARSPMGLTADGQAARMGEWDDPSDAARRRALGRRRSARAALERRFRPAELSAQDRLSLRLFAAETDLMTLEARHAARHFVWEHMDGPHATGPAFLMARHRVRNAADAQAYCDRLERMPAWLDAWRAVARRRAARGVMAHAASLDRTLAQARGVVKGAPFDDGPPSALMADVTAKFAAVSDAGERARLLARATTALKQEVGPAYARVIADIAGQLAQASPEPGVWRLPDGAAFYAERLAHHTTTRLTAAEIHDKGLREVARLRAEMASVARRTGFTGDVAAFFEVLRTRADLYYPATPEGRDAALADAKAYTAQMTAALPSAFGRLPRARVEVRRIEPFREATAGRAFYQRPPADGSGPGLVFVNLSDPTLVPKYQLEALFYHEGVPGHHLQIALADETLGLPEFRRRGGWTAYIEGWALYAERLAKELGGYRDAWAEAGQLALELRRAARLVVDTGIHDKRWSRQEAIDWIVANTPDSPSDAAQQIDRYGVMPGQATAYTIGLLEVVAMRTRAEARLADRFDLIAWHDALLALGALPLWAAVSLHEGASLLVALNSLRVLLTRDSGPPPASAPASAVVDRDEAGAAAAAPASAAAADAAPLARVPAAVPA